jgi:hypothetical protein
VTLSSAPFWVWWLLPVVGTGLVAAVVRVARRERGPRDGFDSVDEYARFRSAMAHVRGPEHDHDHEERP